MELGVCQIHIFIILFMIFIAFGFLWFCVLYFVEKLFQINGTYNGKLFTI